MLLFWAYHLVFQMILPPLLQIDFSSILLLSIKKLGRHHWCNTWKQSLLLIKTLLIQQRRKSGLFNETKWHVFNFIYNSGSLSKNSVLFKRGILSLACLRLALDWSHYSGLLSTSPKFKFIQYRELAQFLCHFRPASLALHKSQYFTCCSIKSHHCSH